MPTFSYEGKTRSGKEITGELDAKDQQELFRLLRRSEVTVTKVRKKPKELSLSFGSGVKTSDITRFARQFSTMIGAGVPIVQCLEILSSQAENKKFGEILNQITRDVQSGRTLADAMSRSRDIFGDLFIHMIEAGEMGGILESVLLRLAAYMEKALTLRRKVRGAMVYPVAIFSISLVGAAALLTFVIPIFAKMFADFGGQLPAPTRLVIALSDFLRDNFFYLLFGIVALIYLFRRFSRSSGGREILDRLILKMPVLGDIQRKTAIARFSRTLGTLLSSGVSILEAFDVTAKTSGNVVLEKAISNMSRNIATGKSISEPMRDTGVFPPMVIQMVSIGEQSGTLPEMLSKIADFYDEEVNSSTDVLISLMEPLIIVFVAIFMGGMLIAMYMPIFDLMEQI